jgi:hypothetical protein
MLREAVIDSEGLSSSFVDVARSGPADVPNPFDDEAASEQADTSASTNSGTSTELLPASVYAPPAGDPSECASTGGTFTAENLIDGDLSTSWAFESDIVGRRFEFEFTSPVHLTSVAIGGLMSGSCGSLDADDVRAITGIRWTFEDGTTVRQEPEDPAGLDSISVDVVTSSVTMDITSTGSAPDDREWSFISEVAFEGYDTDEVPLDAEVDGLLCDPPEQLGHGVELDHYENEEFEVVICRNDGEFLYYGHSKGELGAIVLTAQTTGYGYVARNGAYSYEVHTGGGPSLRVLVNDEVLADQPLTSVG